MLAPRARVNKTGSNFMIFILIFVKKISVIQCFNDFSAWPRTGSNQADISRFRILTGEAFPRVDYIYLFGGIREVIWGNNQITFDIVLLKF